jgi:hypothetical protein
MKIVYLRTLTSLLLATLIIGTNGCMTQGAIKYAQGHPDQAWIKTLSNSPISKSDYKPHPAYYVLLPLSVPADVATSPFQLIGFGYFEFMGYAMRNGGME